MKFMLTIDEVGTLLDEIAEEIPKEFYRYLNGGIILFDEEKPHPRAPGKLCIMGEYHNQRDLGRCIRIYYGSFARVYGHLSPAAAKAELRKILLHEFTHHLESLAGERDLEITDAIQIEDFLNPRKGQGM